MGAKTGIEWTDATWNPIRGCSRVSEGCRHCYAETMATRFSGPGLAYEGLAVMQNGQPHWTGKIEFVEEHLLDPLKWGPVKVPCIACQAALVAGVIDSTHGCTESYTRPRRIFVNSMSDLFHENVTDEMRDKIFAVMALCPHHVFQVLTKRPARMLEYLTAAARTDIGLQAMGITMENYRPSSHLGKGLTMSCNPGREGELTVWPLPNVWLGVSVENQKAADDRIESLLRTPAAVRFISAEPLLGPISLRWKDSVGFGKTHPRHKFPELSGRGSVVTNEYDGLRELDWVICGGESGPGARPMHPDWARGLRDQCAAAGVPFFFKQWGEYLPAMTDGGLDRSGAQVLNASDQPQRVGKHAAGALLDGVEWKKFPEVRA